MGKRGPKSTAELSLITTNLADRTRNRASNAKPAPPDHLSDATRVWWQAIVLQFNFEPHQYRTLQGAAEAWDRYEQAREALAQHGLTFEDSKGMIRARPEIAIERDSRTAYLRALRELDLEKVAPPNIPKPWERET